MQINIKSTSKARLTSNNQIKASKIHYQLFNPKLVKLQVQNLAVMKIVRDNTNIQGEHNLTISFKK